MSDSQSSRFELTNVISNVIWKFLERGSSLLVTIIVNVFLARLLFPEEHGLLTMIMVFVSIAEIFVTAGVNTALTQKKDADEKDFSSMFWANVVTAGIIYLGLFFLAPIISRIIDYKELVWILRVLSLRIIAVAVNSIQCAYVARNMLFKYYFTSTLLGKVLSGIIGIGFALLGFGVWALVAQSVSIIFIETIVLWVVVKWRPKAFFSWGKIKELYPYTWRVTLTSFVENITEQIRNLLIGVKNTSADLAYYNKGNLFPSALTVNITSATISVVFSVMSQQQDSLDRVKKLCRYWIGVLAFIVVPILIGLVAVSDIIIPILFTEKWMGMIPYMRIACGVFFAWIIEVPIREAIRSVGRADIGLRMQIIKMVISIAILVITIKFGAIVIAFGSFISAIINIGISMSYGRKYLNYRFREVIADILPTMILSIGMGIIVVLSAKVVEPNVWGLVVQIVIGIVVYVGGAVLTHNKFLSMGISYVKKIKRGHDE